MGVHGWLHRIPFGYFQLWFGLLHILCIFFKLLDQCWHVYCQCVVCYLILKDYCDSLSSVSELYKWKKCYMCVVGVTACEAALKCVVNIKDGNEWFK